MAKFKIEYDDPATGERKEVVAEFFYTPAQKTNDGLEVGGITPREWAEDHAYSLADKNTNYTITEIK